MPGWKKILTELNTATLTNKTYSDPHLNGAVDGTAIDTDTSLSANSDTVIPSQKAIKAYVDINSSSVSAVGTDGTSWIIDKDSTVGKFRLERGDDGSDHTVALKAPTTTANQEITLPDATGTVALCDAGGNFDQQFEGTVYFGNAKALAFSTSADNGRVTIANSITNSSTISGGINFGGPVHTAGDYTSLAPIQPTDYRLIELPDDSGIIALTGSASTQSFTGTVQTSKLQVGGSAGARSISIDNTGTGEIQWEGATINAYKTILNVLEPTAANSDVNTITLPDDTGRVALTFTENSQRLTGGLHSPHVYHEGTCPITFELITDDTGISGSDDDTYNVIATTKIDGAGDNNLTITIVIASGEIAWISAENTGKGYAWGDTVTLTGLTDAGCTGANNDAVIQCTGFVTADIKYNDNAQTNSIHTLPTGDGTFAMTNDLDGSSGVLSDMLPLAGGTMAGAIDMDGFIVKGVNLVKFDERTNYTGANLMSGEAALYVTTAEHLMFKSNTHGTGAGDRVMTSLSNDSAPELGGVLDVDGRDMKNIADSRMYWVGEASADRMFEIEVTNTGQGAGIIKLNADFLLTGRLSAADGSSTFVLDENDLGESGPMPSGDDRRIATQQSIKAYVDKYAQFIYLKSGFNYAYAGGTKVYIPIGSAELARDQSLPPLYSENLLWLAPHDGEVVSIQFRASSAADTVVFGIHIVGDGTLTPSTTPDASVTEECPTANTTYDFDFSGEANNDFSKGDVMMISVDPDNDINDTIIMVKLKLDTTT